jgi:hypothetical protein
MKSWFKKHEFSPIFKVEQATINTAVLAAAAGPEALPYIYANIIA